MRAKTRLVATMGIAALALASCGSNKSAAVGSTITTLPAPIPVTITTTTVPANAPVGFNANKSYFVLPHNLGLLPGPELALAKADPAYAAGLANLGDWVQTGVSVLADPKTYGGLTYLGSKPPQTITAGMWFYMGSYGGNLAISAANDLLNDKTDMVESNQFGFPWVTPVLHSTSVRVVDSTLHNISTTNGNATTTGFRVSAPVYDTLVAPSALEDQAAPVGTLKAPVGTLPAFCVPVPEAYLLNNKVVNIPSKGYPHITAGPSSIFAFYMGATTAAQPVPYDEGTASCVSFS